MSTTYLYHQKFRSSYLGSISFQNITSVTWLTVGTFPFENGMSDHISTSYASDMSYNLMKQHDNGHNIKTMVH